MISVREGDKHPVTLTVNADLTGATVRGNMRRRYGDLVPFAVTVTDPAGGVLTHHLTGELEPGVYELEIEVTRDEEIVTFPTIGATQLRVVDAID